MTCDQCREALSARMDGEAAPSPDAHLAVCADCRRFSTGAEAVGRLVRASPPAPYLASVDPVVLRAVPVRRSVALLRKALGALGAAQFTLGLAQITSFSQLSGHHAGGVSSAHLWHESAAWNLAIGAAFGWVAWRRTRTAGLLPLLTAFVSAIVILGVGDLANGLVDPARLVSHGLIVAGYAIVWLLSRPSVAGDDPGTGGERPRSWRARFDPEPLGELAPVIPLRPAATAHYREAA